jgi:hypothetical protein
MYMTYDTSSIQQAQTVVLLILCFALFIADGNNRQLVKFLSGCAMVCGLLLYHMHCQLQQYASQMEYFTPSTTPPVLTTQNPTRVAHAGEEDENEMIQDHYSPATKGADTMLQQGIFSQQRMRSKNAFGRHSHSELLNRKKARHCTLLHEQRAL